MSEINQLDLLSDDCIAYKKICTLLPPTLKKIKKIGFEKYNEYVNIIHFDVAEFNEQFKTNFNPRQLNIFDILISEPSMRELLCEALSFFIVEKISYSKSYNAFKIDGDKSTNIVGIINRNNYQEIKSGILQINFIHDDTIKPTKSTSKRALKILDKLNKGRSKLAKAKTKESNITIPNMISSIIAYGNNYTYQNIWSLTVYQLYDLFFRLNVKTQMDITGLRWAAWGKDEFDFSIWYKDPTKK